jgi:hypothetical protein
MMFSDMVRAAAFLGMGGLFLAISPKLRGAVTDGLGSVTHQMELYAPFSYIGGVILVITVFVFSMYRGAQPR